MTYFAEIISITGKVQPQLFSEKPPIDSARGRLKRPESLGPRIHHGPVEMTPGHANLTPCQAQAVYGASAKFSKC